MVVTVVSSRILDSVAAAAKTSRRNPSPQETNNSELEALDDMVALTQMKYSPYFKYCVNFEDLNKQKTSGSKTKFQKRRAAKKVSRDRNSMISSLLLSECELLELEIEEYSTKPEKSLDVSYIINTSPTDFPVDNPNLDEKTSESTGAHNAISRNPSSLLFNDNKSITPFPPAADEDKSNTMLALVVDQNSFYSDAEDSSDDCSISDEGLLEKLDSKEGLIAAQLAIGNLIRASLNQGDSNITCMQLEDDRICEIFEDDDVSLVAGNTICIKKKSWLLPKKMKHGMEKIGSKLFKKTQSNSVSVFESGAIATTILSLGAAEAFYNDGYGGLFSHYDAPEIPAMNELKQKQQCKKKTFLQRMNGFVSCLIPCIHHSQKD